MSVFDDKDFDEAANANGSLGGGYFAVGTFAVMVNRCAEGTSRKNGPFTVVETTVIESDTPDQKPKSKPSAQFMKKWDGWANLMKDFGVGAAQAMGASAADAKQVAGKDLKELFGEGQPMAGRLIGVTTYKKSGKDFTNYTWFPLDAAAYARVTAKAKELDIIGVR